MKRIMIYNLAVFLLLFVSSCEPKEEKICDKFAQGITNEEVLISTKWKFESFGYTVNGNSIKKKEKIDNGYIIFHEPGLFSFSYRNRYGGNYIVDKNKLTFISRNMRTDLGCTKKEKEMEEWIEMCVFSSICYKIDKEKLYIHTKEVKNCNVLILKKESQ